MKSIRQTLAYSARVITAAPFMALLLFGMLYLHKPSLMTDLPHFLWSVGFFTLLPLLAYPTALICPRLRAGGRTAERKLAIVFSVIGYLAGLCYLAVAGGTTAEWMTYLTYACSGVAIALFSFVFRFKASGHSCGVSGPVAMLAFQLGAPWLALYLLLGVVFWASLRMKRHTVGQLLVGGAIPVFVIIALAQVMI